MKFIGILIGSEDPKRLVDYYTKILGKPAMTEGPYTTWQIGGAWVSVGPHDEVKGRNAQPGRIIWNIESADVKGDFARFKATGAKVIREPYDPEGSGKYLIATFADPDENYFQLMNPM